MMKTLWLVALLLASSMPALAQNPVTVVNGSAVDPNDFAITTNAATTEAATAASGCYRQSTLSTNSQNCKASAGNFYGFRAINTTATIYYLRMYNLASAPTCSSATGYIESIPIPAGGGIMTIVPIPINYTAGIGFCITGGPSSVDNTNAAVGIFLAVYTK